MVKIKNGVTPRNLVILAAIANCAWDLPYDITITSGTDGKHMEGSKHYTGDALDVRIFSFPSARDKNLFFERVALRLGKDYEVIMEGDHCHIEYDPA